jgi:uncharacterized protein Usg
VRRFILEEAVSQKPDLAPIFSAEENFLEWAPLLKWAQRLLTTPLHGDTDLNKKLIVPDQCVSKNSRELIKSSPIPTVHSDGDGLMPLHKKKIQYQTHR